MTPNRCKTHEHSDYAAGGYACAKCALLALAARIAYGFNKLTGKDLL